MDVTRRLPHIANSRVQIVSLGTHGEALLWSRTMGRIKMPENFLGLEINLRCVEAYRSSRCLASSTKNPFCLLFAVSKVLLREFLHQSLQRIASLLGDLSRNNFHYGKPNHLCLLEYSTSWQDRYIREFNRAYTDYYQGPPTTGIERNISLVHSFSQTTSLAHLAHLERSPPWLPACSDSDRNCGLRVDHHAGIAPRLKSTAEPSGFCRSCREAPTNRRHHNIARSARPISKAWVWYRSSAVGPPRGGYPIANCPIHTGIIGRCASGSIEVRG